MDYFASERFAAYLEWIQTAYDYPVITRADGTQEEHPYRKAAWSAYLQAGGSSSVLTVSV